MGVIKKILFRWKKEVAPSALPLTLSQYEESDNRQGFTVTNPNATSTDITIKFTLMSISSANGYVRILANSLNVATDTLTYASITVAGDSSFSRDVYFTLDVEGGDTASVKCEVIASTLSGSLPTTPTLETLSWVMPTPPVSPTLITSSPSKFWSPNEVLNTGSTLTWVATGAERGTIVANDPTFDFDKNDPQDPIFINVSPLSGVTRLNVSNEYLEALNLSQATGLTRLSCYSNLTPSGAFTSLDLTSNTLLTQLYCYTNDLTFLDVSGCTLLTIINCSSNNFSSTGTNYILASLVANGTENGVLTFDDNATGQGITDKATLVTRGWVFL